MRILIKGGVWKNTEDEILKAAVMKYGKNQWARVASLLNRKSSNQCKARWYEWLDPSIKKTEWNRDEEEKLLHLAKLMPNQWRTIAPIVGRTAGQCIDHYEFLLDQAQTGLEGTGEAGDDPRKLRPGEIDPAPETKPARPDPIDMDEDEKEMLSEARARLANTKGKKAKRKIRELQLNQSRTLSSLQKRRELKAAGIESKLGGRVKRKHIDYAREIPFQKVAPSGFYDIGDEKRIGTKSILDPKAAGLEIAKMEGRHEKEDKAKDDARDKKRLKTLFKANAAVAIMKISEQNDPTSLRKRSLLTLPSPQVTEGELEDIVKIGQKNLMLPPSGLGASRGVTQALVGDYSSINRERTSSTPMRTPMQEDIIMQEARNARTLRDMTPLAGEELGELYEGTGFDGVKPRSRINATPNSLNLTTPRGSVMNTPGSFVSVSSNFTNNSQMRDAYGLNNSSFSDTSSFNGDNDYDNISIDSRRSKQSLSSNNLMNSLKSLPAPEYTYDITLPTTIDNNEEIDDSTSFVEDANDIMERELRIKKQNELIELEKRSTVIKRNLPRPSYISKSLNHSSLDLAKYPMELVAASSMINEEMTSLLRYDEYNHVDSSNKKVKSSRDRSNMTSSELEIYDAEELFAASQLILEEVNKNQAISLQQFESTWEGLYKDKVYVPNSDNEGEYVTKCNKNDLLSSLNMQFSTLRGKIEKDSKKANKIESKLNLTTNGYDIRSKKLNEMILDSYENYSNLVISHKSFLELQKIEKKMLPKRINKLKFEMIESEKNEKKLQLKYKHLLTLITKQQDLAKVAVSN